MGHDSCGVLFTVGEEICLGTWLNCSSDCPFVTFWRNTIASRCFFDFRNSSHVNSSKSCSFCVNLLFYECFITGAVRSCLLGYLAVINVGPRGTSLETFVTVISALIEQGGICFGSQVSADNNSGGRFRHLELPVLQSNFSVSCALSLEKVTAQTVKTSCIVSSVLPALVDLEYFNVLFCVGEVVGADHLQIKLERPVGMVSFDCPGRL